MQGSIPVLGLIFWLAVAGWFFDGRYIRAGGVRPPTSDKRYLAIACGLCVAALLLLGLAGADGGAIGDATFLLMSLVFGLWEFRRYRIRRTHPLGLPKPPE